MVRGSPTLTLVAVFVVVFLVETVAAALSLPFVALALSAPVDHRPWTVVTSVYAHGSVGHLVGNSVILLLVGLVLERRTSRVRFHLFFLASGAIAGLAEVWVSGLVGSSVSVVGASGAIFALVGYVLAGNPVSDTVLSRAPVSPRVQLVVFAGVAAAVTLVTAGRGVALVAHFTGLLVGLLAGRAHLLRT